MDAGMKIYDYRMMAYIVEGLWFSIAWIGFNVYTAVDLGLG